MVWDKQTIINKIYEAIDRKLGQRYSQLLNLLRKRNPEEVFEILYFIVIDNGRPPEKKMWDQEWAGSLLFELQPICPIDPKIAIYTILKHYDFSVEEIPWYFADILGKEKVLSILNELELEQLSEYEIQSLNTFRYWLKPTKDVVFKWKYKERE